MGFEELDQLAKIAASPHNSQLHMLRPESECRLWWVTASIQVTLCRYLRKVKAPPPPIPAPIFLQSEQMIYQLYALTSQLIYIFAMFQLRNAVYNSAPHMELNHVNNQRNLSKSYNEYKAKRRKIKVKIYVVERHQILQI